MMQGFGVKWRTGVRWLTCGWRLFNRNPWLLIPMGGLSVLLIMLVALIPLLGALVVAALAPILLASTLLALDLMTRLKRPLPAGLRGQAIKQSAKELFSVFRDDKRLMPMVVFSVYSLLVALLTSMAILALVGPAWAKPLANLGGTAMLSVMGVALLALAIYVLLAMSLIYALPLAFFLDEDVVPAIVRSFKTGVSNLVALTPIFLVLLAPFGAAALVSYFSPLAAYAAKLLIGAPAWPVAAAGVYCSYRTQFTVKESTAA